MIEIDPTAPDKKFIEKMKHIIIPAVDDMIRKEKQHQIELENTLKKIRESGVFDTRRFFSDPPERLINEYLKRSKEYLKHYETRLKEYQEYVKKFE